MSTTETTPPTADSGSSEEQRRDELRARIDAAEARNRERSFADYAREAQQTATDFVKEHPIKAVAGVAAIGLVIGALTPPGRRVARRAGTGALSLGTMAAELAALYGAKTMNAAGDVARSSQDSLEDLGDNIGRKARNLQRSARFSAAETGDDLRLLGRRARRGAGRGYRDLKARMR